jgi:hypothetical protein
MTISKEQHNTGMAIVEIIRMFNCLKIARKNLEDGNFENAKANLRQIKLYLEFVDRCISRIAPVSDSLDEIIKSFPEKVS